MERDDNRPFGRVVAALDEFLGPSDPRPTGASPQKDVSGCPTPGCVGGRAGVLSGPPNMVSQSVGHRQNVTEQPAKGFTRGDFPGYGLRFPGAATRSLWPRAECECRGWVVAERPIRVPNASSVNAVRELGSLRIAMKFRPLCPNPAQLRCLLSFCAVSQPCESDDALGRGMRVRSWSPEMGSAGRAYG